MMPTGRTNIPVQHVLHGSWESANTPLVARKGFREYDARWRYPEEINLPGMSLVGPWVGVRICMNAVSNP